MQKTITIKLRDDKNLLVVLANIGAIEECDGDVAVLYIGGFKFIPVMKYSELIALVEAAL